MLHCTHMMIGEQKHKNKLYKERFLKHFRLMYVRPIHVFSNFSQSCTQLSTHLVAELVKYFEFIQFKEMYYFVYIFFGFELVTQNE